MTLSRAINTTTFCASLSTPSTPFITCLIGVPVNDTDNYLLNATICDFKKQWCHKFDRNETHPAPGTLHPRRLPAGLFLICGNRAWNGIPASPVGGPCTIGRLSLALPHHHLKRAHPIRRRREVSQVLENTCDDNVQLWSKWETIFASFFTPGVAAARAHRNLETLSCWVVKQARYYLT